MEKHLAVDFFPMTFCIFIYVCNIQFIKKVISNLNNIKTIIIGCRTQYMLPKSMCFSVTHGKHLTRKMESTHKYSTKLNS